MELQTEKSSMWQRSTTRRFLAWLFSPRILRRCLFGFAALVTLIMLAYAFENWRGKRAWEKYKRQAEARGEHLDWKSFVPPAVPDEQNFAATPFLRLLATQHSESEAFKQRWPEDFRKASDNLNKLRKKKNAKSRNPKERRLTDLVGWQLGFENIRTGNKEIGLPSDTDPAARAKAATAVLEYLKPYESALEELGQASPRPFSRFDLNYEEENPMVILLPHLGSMKGICQVLQLRAVAELTLGRSDQAYQDALLMLRLNDGLKDDPFLISYLVRVAMLHITANLVWEGLAEQQWSEAQLQGLQTRFQQMDCLADMRQALGSERAYALKFFDYIRSKKNKGQVLHDLCSWDASGKASFAELAFNLFPRGWIYLEQRNYGWLFDKTIMDSMSSDPKRIDPTRCNETERDFERSLKRGPAALFNHTLFSGLLLPALTRIQTKGAEAQTLAHQVAAACALERYRQANGHWPDQLDALVPRFFPKIPADVITGQPLLYHLTNDGQFVLYSVGWDEKDDGGFLPPKLVASTERQDWVWRYPSPR